MPSPTDAWRQIADTLRALPVAFGLRPTTVTVVTEQWSAAVGTYGAQLLTTTPVAITPTPKVAVTAWQPSAFGGGRASGSSADLLAASVTVGPITPPYPGGGFDATALDPAPADPSQRVYLQLAGGAFDPAGEKFTVTRKDGAKALHTTLYAERMTQDDG